MFSFSMLHRAIYASKPVWTQSEMSMSYISDTHDAIFQPWSSESVRNKKDLTFMLWTLDCFSEETGSWSLLPVSFQWYMGRPTGRKFFVMLLRLNSWNVEVSAISCTKPERSYLDACKRHLHDCEFVSFSFILTFNQRKITEFKFGRNISFRLYVNLVRSTLKLGQWPCEKDIL